MMLSYFQGVSAQKLMWKQGGSASPNNQGENSFRGGKKGFLKIAANRPKANLLNIYKLGCEATDREFIIQETPKE